MHASQHVLSRVPAVALLANASRVHAKWARESIAPAAARGCFFDACGRPPNRHPRSVSDVSTAQRLGVFAVLGLFAVVLLRTAWLCDDAYITLRSVDNLVNGFGPRWNVAERVQTFTHPLWMGVLSVFYALTREPFFTTLFVSIAVSLGAMVLFAFRIARSSGLAIVGVLVLTLSRAYVDYSTSGLENPLTHLLLAVFLAGWFGGRSLLWLSLVASLGMLNRLDTGLLFLPPLVASLVAPGTPRRWRSLVLGFLPLAAWELFSLLYYGAPVPNTAYAKLDIGVEGSALLAQGFGYLLNSLERDPLTGLAIAVGLSVPLIMRERRYAWVAIGVVLYLLYVVRIGGDFMSGRYLTGPLFASVCLIARVPGVSAFAATLLGLAVVGIGLAAPHPTPTSGASYGDVDEPRIDARGIADERMYYYRMAGLLRARPGVELPTANSAREGREARARGERVVVRRNIGFFGYYAGPGVHIVDPLGLGDPLLSRLLPTPLAPRRIGHARRALPMGYLESLPDAANRIEDAAIARLYDDVRLATRGPLLAGDRWAAIWRLGSGAHRAEAERFVASSTRFTLAEIERPKERGTRWDHPGNLVIPTGGIRIDLGAPWRSPQLELSVDHNDAYQLEFRLRDEPIAVATVESDRIPGGGLRVDRVDVPAAAVARGYDEIAVTPRAGDGLYALGHLRLLE